MTKRGRRPHPDILTPREQEVLRLLREGLTNEQIALRLGITERTAKFHVSEILSKLGLSSRQEAAQWSEEQARPWWLGSLAMLAWPLRKLPASIAMKAAGATVVVAAAGGLAVLMWAVLVTGGTTSDDSSPVAGGVSTAAQLGNVAFVGDGDIFVRNLDSGQERRLTEDGNNLSPRWSADGDWVAFQKTKPEEGGFFSFTGVWTVKATGSDTTKIVDGPTEAAWSPVEPLLAYGDNSDWTLWVANADGSDRRKILDDVGPPQRFAWSPDGKQLAVERWVYREEPGADRKTVVDQGIWLVNRDGSELRKLYGPYLDSAQGRVVHLGGWSQDGDLLSFWEGPLSSSLTADGVEFGVLSLADGSPIRPSGQLRGLVYKQFLQWAPGAGTLLAVTGGPRETFCNKRLMLYSPSPGTTANLSAEGRVDINPSWSPDGSQIAYVSSEETPPAAGTSCNTAISNDEATARRRIWMMGADGSSKRQLTDDPSYADDSPQWSADASTILFARERTEAIVQGGSNPTPVELWLMRPDGSDKRMVVDGLTTNWFGYYGFIDWSQIFDWYQPPVRGS